MTVKEYVERELCIPVTRIGFKYLVGAIEYVVDTHEHKFYPRISKIYKVTARYLEKALRDAKTLGLAYMDTGKRNEIFGREYVATVEYVIKAAEYYRREVQKDGV